MSHPVPGAPVDVAPFAERPATDANAIVLRWAEPRDIERVVIRWAGAAPAPSKVRIEYWQSYWPEKRIPKGIAGGASWMGWLHEGDWYNGRLQSADVDLARDGATWSYAFRPVNAREFPALTDFAETYRRTFMIRVAADGALPAIDSLETYTGSRWREVALSVEWPGGANPGDFSVEAYNGHVASRSNGPSGRADLRVLAVENPDPTSHDRTVVTFRTARYPFSVLVDDLIDGGPILVRESGAFVTLAGSGITRAAYEEDRKKRGAETFYDRIFREPEQTLPRAWAGLPAKRPFHFVIGAEGRRQRFGVEPDGTLFRENGEFFRRAPGKDTPRIEGDDRWLRWSFGLPPVPPTERTPLRGYLPIMRTGWDTSGLRYLQDAWTVLLDREHIDRPIRGDDTVVAIARFVVFNNTEKPQVARFFLTTKSGDAAEALHVESDDDGNVAVRNGDGRLRYAFEAPGGATIAEERGGIVIAVEADPLDVVNIAFRIPWFDLTAGETERLFLIDDAAALAATTDYWERRIGESARITTPEPLIDDFYRAHVAHVLINHERHPATGDDPYPCDIARVGSFRYGEFPNESVMQITDLDRRGYHDEAASGYETLLRWQGTVPLPGDYSGHDGVFYGSGGYECGEYNQNHGWVLWGLGEHWFVTRDRAWMERAAPRIVAACDWIARERRRTMHDAADGRRPPEYGFLPASTLEDIRDWWVWLSTNAYTWWGLNRAAEALADFGHPDATRFAEEARAFGADLIAGYTEAMVRAPVVRLRDGTAIAHFPSHQHLRGRSYGWIRETLEGAIHLIRTELFPPDSPLGASIMADYEDNLYLSDRFGYTVPDLARHWFSRGGFSQQPNLLCGPIPYLFRDEIAHYVRAYFNSFAVGLHADTRMMTEHPLPEMGEWAGDHYKSSDESNSTYWLRLMFAWERGDELALGFAIPRYWLAPGNVVAIERAKTYFGELSLRIESDADRGTIAARISPPTRTPPRRILLRLRHPDGKRLAEAMVNGRDRAEIHPDGETIILPALAHETVVVGRYAAE